MVFLVYLLAKAVLYFLAVICIAAYAVGLGVVLLTRLLISLGILLVGYVARRPAVRRDEVDSHAASGEDQVTMVGSYSVSRDQSDLDIPESLRRYLVGRH